MPLSTSDLLLKIKKSLHLKFTQDHSKRLVWRHASLRSAGPTLCSSSLYIWMAEAVYIDGATAITTLSLAEPSYQSCPGGVQVDMDTVNIAGITLPTVLKVQPCVMSASVCTFCILHIKLTAKKLPMSAISFVSYFTLSGSFDHWVANGSTK